MCTGVSPNVSQMIPFATEVSYENIPPSKRFEALRAEIKNQPVYKIQRSGVTCPQNIDDLLGWNSGGFAGHAVSSVLVGSTLILSRAADAVRFSRFRSLPAETIAGSHSPNWSIAVSFGVGALALFGAGVGTGISFQQYQTFSTELEGEIIQVYNLLGNPEAPLEALREALLSPTHRVGSGLSVSVFQYFRAGSYIKFLMARGIMFDSSADFLAAQACYAEALQLARNPLSIDQLHYLYARSLRLSGAPQGDVAAHLQFVASISPMQWLAQTERDRLMSRLDSEVFDEDGIPIVLKCPLSDELMQDPVFYFIGKNRFFVERQCIEDWLRRQSSCPFTRQPLSVENLQPDPELAQAILYWQFLRLKNK